MAWKNLDAVAYVRFASVYRDFREAKDFETFVGELSEGKAGARMSDGPDRRFMAAAIRLGQARTVRPGRTRPWV
jgi:hypothetical protein